MENASKALLMAAGVLIGVLILTLAVYLFATFGATSAELHKQQATDRLNEFNSQFTSYEGKEGLTIYDVITVANLATESNKYYNIQTKNVSDFTLLPPNQSDNYVSVFVKNMNIAYGIEVSTPTKSGKEKEKENDEKNNKLIQDESIDNNTNSLPKYRCETHISNVTQRVYAVVFTQIP